MSLFFSSPVEKCCMDYALFAASVTVFAATWLFVPWCCSFVCVCVCVCDLNILCATTNDVFSGFMNENIFIDSDDRLYFKEKIDAFSASPIFTNITQMCGFCGIKLADNSQSISVEIHVNDVKCYLVIFRPISLLSSDVNFIKLFPITIWARFGRQSSIFWIIYFIVISQLRE